MGDTHLRWAFGLRTLEEHTEQGLAFVSPGSRHFYLLPSWLESRGQVLWTQLTPTQDKVKDVPAALQGEGSRGNIKVRDSVVFDLEVAAKIAFISEGRDELLALVWAPAEGGGSRSEQSLIEHWQAKTTLTPIDPLATKGLPSQRQVAERLEQALAELSKVARLEARPRETTLLEYLSREAHRLTNYYGELIAQHEDDEERREQLAADLDRRISEEVANHQLGIEVDVITYAVVVRPQQSVSFERKGETVRWRFDRVSGDWFDDDGIRYEPGDDTGA